MPKRDIVKIDEEKCTGCGECVPACAEGAIQIIDGKAKLVGEVYCDGLGDCIGHCPEGAITVERREAAEFDQRAVKKRLAEMEEAACECHAHAPACPSAAATTFEREEPAVPDGGTGAPSRLGHWPVQLMLVAPGAPFMKNADVLLAADCTAYASGAFHDGILAGRALAVTCPKFNDMDAETARFAAVLREAEPKSLTVAVMEVPCCNGLLAMTQAAVKASGVDVPVKAVRISIRGELLEEFPVTC